MVLRNSIGKHGGSLHYDNPPRKPRKFLFEIGDYEVSFHKQRGCSPKYFHCAIWHHKEVVGNVDLSTTFEDVKSILSVSTTIVEPYQGLGIAYRVYEGLVCNHNMCIHTSNQSKGAIKLWHKLIKNPDLGMYFVNDMMNECFFDCDVFEVRLNDKSALEGVDYDGKPFSPYRKGGGLILVKKKSAADETIQRFVSLKLSQRRLAADFKKQNDRLAI